MIQVTLSTNRFNGCISLRLSGHAGAGETGKDIICASASILSYTVAQTLKFMHFKGDLKKKPHIKLKEGSTVITACPKAEAYDEAFHTFFVAQVGYSLLEHNYPDYVSLDITEFGKA